MCGNMYSIRSRAILNDAGRPDDFITNFDISEESIYREAIKIFSSKSTGIHLSIEDAWLPKNVSIDYLETHKSLRCKKDPGVYDDLHEFWEIFYELKKE